MGTRIKKKKPVHICPVKVSYVEVPGPKEVVYRVPLAVLALIFSMAVSLGFLGYWVSQPPIEKPYPVYVHEPDRDIERAYRNILNDDNEDRIQIDKWFNKFNECRSDYKAQRETIRILTLKAKSQQ